MKPENSKKSSGRASELEDDEAPTTVTLTVYGKLRVEILDAVLPPGRKLKVKDICLRYGVGVSPVREALNRLTSEGLVNQSAQRGFTVTEISSSDLEELALARKWMNEIGLRQSIMNANETWEESVLVSFHRLSRQRRIDATGHRNLEWDAAHRHFHNTLLSGCGSSWLINIAGMLFDASERYRAISRLKGNASRDHLGEHRAIMNAAIERNTDIAVMLLNAHFERTTGEVLVALNALPAEHLKNTI